MKEIKHMSLEEMENEIYGWGLYQDGYFKNEEKITEMWQLVDRYLEDGETFIKEDTDYEVEDCNYYISICNCAIENYPDKDIFEEHLKCLKELKQKYTQNN